ncbi:MAG: hypothetical protein LC745_05350 [Planctomycetia bacterium]|nr:hypothetical protein [Planctomycetia bacterium]
MSTVNYDNIEPNIAEVDVNGATVNVKWKCPVSGGVVCQSSAGMKPLADTTTVAKGHVQKTLLKEAISAFNRFISQTFGATAGKVAVAASGAVHQGAERSIGKPVFNTATEHEAVVNAFKQVESQFKWDEDRELFVAAPKG